MSGPWIHLCVAVLSLGVVSAQQQCYFGPGAEHRATSNLVPCNTSGQSACCLLGDVCLSGNACWNYATGNTYQYGCTDINYKDASCPYKCGFDTAKSPWVAMVFCGPEGFSNTWACQSPDSCASNCKWNGTDQLGTLSPVGCKAMGDNGRAAAFAPSKLAPYLSLPTQIGGKTGYFSPIVVSGTSTWITTVVTGYTPNPVTQLTDYGAQPTSIVLINKGALPTRTSSTSSSSSSSSSSPSSSSSRSIPLPSSMQTTSTNAASSSTSSLTTASTSTPTSSPGLSLGVKAGVGLGVAGLGIAAIITLFAFFLWRRPRSHTPHHLLGQEKAELPADGKLFPPWHWRRHIYHEAPSSEAQYSSSELDASSPRDTMTSRLSGYTALSQKSPETAYIGSPEGVMSPWSPQGPIAELPAEEKMVELPEEPRKAA